MQNTRPLRLIFDDEPLETLLYGNNNGRSTPVDVLDRCRFTGEVAPQELAPLLAVLSQHPDKAEGLSKSVLTTITTEMEKQFSSGLETDAHSIFKMANIYQATGELEKAEQGYRLALDGNDLVLPLSGPQRSQVMHNLASLYSGHSRDAEAQEWQIMGDAEKSLAESSSFGLYSVRSLARNLFMAGRYAAAEQLYRRLLERKFERPGTLTHLCRALVMQDRFSEAIPAIEEAWNLLKDKSIFRETPRYVLARIVFLRIIFAMVQDQSYDRLLFRLRRELCRYRERMEWTIEPVIEHLRLFLDADDLNMLHVMTEAINGRAMDPFLAMAVEPTRCC